MPRLAMMVLWPSFVAAAIAEGIFFSLFAPDDLWVLPPMAAYSIGFIFFWMMCTLASLLTHFLGNVPGDHG